MPVSFKSREVIESKVAPGVSFTVRRLNKIQRAKRDLDILATRQQLGRIAIEYGELNGVPEGTRTPEQVMRMNDLDREYTFLEDRDVKPAVLRAGVISIEGLEIDCAAATVDSLIETSGSDNDALIDEIFGACLGLSGLGAAEIKNSSSDTTSAAPGATGPEVSDATSAAS